MTIEVECHRGRLVAEHLLNHKPIAGWADEWTW